MKYQMTKIATLGLAFALTIFGGASASAWGPERPLYTMEEPATHAVFNSISNNAAIGDERDFVRIVEVDSGKTFTSELEVEPGKVYAVYIYYHNDASETFNDSAHNYAGVARDVRVTSYFPEALSAGERGKIDGVITASNTDPKSVWDEAYITATEDLTIKYVDGSAKVYNQWPTNGTELPADDLFSSHGAFLGLTEFNGVILGCDKYAGQVIYRLETEAVETDNGETDPEAPVPTPTTPSENLPSELPTTGPIEISLLVVIVVALVAGFVYWRKSNKAVKRATHKATRGRKK